MDLKWISFIFTSSNNYMYHAQVQLVYDKQLANAYFKTVWKMFMLCHYEIMTLKIQSNAAYEIMTLKITLKIQSYTAKPWNKRNK